MGSEHRLSCWVHSGFSGRNWIPGRETWETGREGPEFWRLGPQSVLQNVPGRPPPTHPDLSGQVGVLGTCGREGTQSPEPSRPGCGRENQGWLGLNLPQPGCRGLHVREGESLGARWRGHPPTCSLWSRRQEHLWQLLPGPLWSDVNRGEPAPTPGQGRTGLWLKDQSPGCLHVERCCEARASGDRSEPCSLITLWPVSHRTGLRWRLQ